jgi:phospholipid/cholesterol/gamma-HCH transport system permease protein
MVVLRYAQEILASIGAAVLALCAATGALLIFAATAVSHLVRPPFYPVEIGRQLLRIGWFSLPVVGLYANAQALALQALLIALVLLGTWYNRSLAQRRDAAA